MINHHHHESDVYYAAVPGSSAVEQCAVNALVVGSIPTPGAMFRYKIPFRCAATSRILLSHSLV